MFEGQLTELNTQNVSLKVQIGDLDVKTSKINKDLDEYVVEYRNREDLKRKYKKLTEPSSSDQPKSSAPGGNYALKYQIVKEQEIIESSDEE